MVPPWTPRVLRPYYTWAAANPPATAVSHIPSTPKLLHPSVRRFWGLVHFYLRRFSRYYCKWMGVPYDNQIAPLPFGLLLKWSDGTRLEEVLATQVCRSAGLPAPYILCYGDHPMTPHGPVSILMTRLPGKELGQAWKTLSPEGQATVLTELKAYIKVIRSWSSPWGEARICSQAGRSVAYEYLTIQLALTKMPKISWTIFWPRHETPNGQKQSTKSSCSVHEDSTHLRDRGQSLLMAI